MPASLENALACAGMMADSSQSLFLFLPVEEILSLLQHLLHHFVGLGIVVIVAVGIDIRGFGLGGRRRGGGGSWPRFPSP